MKSGQFGHRREMKLRDFNPFLEEIWYELGFGDAHPVMDPKPQGAGGGTITRFTLRYSVVSRLRLLISGKTRVSVVVFTEQSNVKILGDHISFNVLPPTI